MRCRLVCKSWQRAQAAGRLVVPQLYLGTEEPEYVPASALGVQRLRPAVRELTIDLGCKSPKAVLGRWNPHHYDVPALEAVLGAVDAMQPPSVSGRSCCMPTPGCSRAFQQSLLQPAGCHVPPRGSFA